jgi:sugar (pentulose or hexulose) kinase
MRVFVGIDLGTTNLKAAAFAGDTGHVLARAACRLPMRSEADGTREQDVPALLSALDDVLAQLRGELGTDWARVAGIGLAAQGGSGALVDGTTGVAHTPLYLWNDSRAATHRAAVAEAKPAEYWRELSQREGPAMGLARLAWLRERVPEAFTVRTRYVGAGELAFHALTGMWRQDACNALQLGCYNVLENRLDAVPLQVVGCDLDLVAPLRDGHRTMPLSPAAAERLGLPMGMPVAGPYMDHEAGFLSALGVGERPLQVSLGTAWVGNFLVPDPTIGYAPVQLVIGSPCGPGHLVVQPLLTGNVSWDWGLRTLIDEDLPTGLNKLDSIFSASLLPPRGVTCLPWFTQGSSFCATAPGGGSFVGLGAHTSRSDLVRALAVGMCCEFQRVFEQVATARLVDGVVLGGGASKGAFFRRLFAALFAPLPVWSLKDEDLAGARGTLHALCPEISVAEPVRVPAESPDMVQAIRQQAEDYASMFASLLGDGGPAAPYRLS